MYIESDVVEYNKPKFCKLLIRLYQPCLSDTNKGVTLYWHV